MLLIFLIHTLLEYNNTNIATTKVMYNTYYNFNTQNNTQGVKYVKCSILHSYIMLYIFLWG